MMFLFSPAGGIFFANKMRTKGYVTMLDPLQVLDLFMLLTEVFFNPTLELFTLQ